MLDFLQQAIGVVVLLAALAFLGWIVKSLITDLMPPKVYVDPDSEVDTEIDIEPMTVAELEDLFKK